MHWSSPFCSFFNIYFYIWSYAHWKIKPNDLLPKISFSELGFSPSILKKAKSASKWQKSPRMLFTSGVRISFQLRLGSPLSKLDGKHDKRFFCTFDEMKIHQKRPADDLIWRNLWNEDGKRCCTSLRRINAHDVYGLLCKSFWWCINVHYFLKSNWILLLNFVLLFHMRVLFVELSFTKCLWRNRM